MKLWLLRPRDQLPDGAENPWDPWYDKAFGFVVRAETAHEARSLANARGGNECEHYPDGKYTKRHPWLDPQFSDCVELCAEGDVGVIIKDFAAA